MEQAKLIIKYQNKYICETNDNMVSFIDIPNYASVSDFNNVDIFIALLCSGNLTAEYRATRGFTYEEGLDIFTVFAPDFYHEIDQEIILYDLDENLSCLDERDSRNIHKILTKLPGNLKAYSFEEIVDLAKENNSNVISDVEEDVSFDFTYPNLQVDKMLVKVLQTLNRKDDKPKVLLMYSGGKDSTLAAIKLKNAGYDVHFIHFDNGHMMDSDKPYVTFKKTFANYLGYTFLYSNRSVDIKSNFENYFEKWKSLHGDILEGGTLASEIRCLSCRMAMYTVAINYAICHGFTYIAEGARISQKFMLEQLPMIEKLKELAALYGIELLFPVLYLENDEEEIQELIANGFSSKGWESKCLLGRSAKDKTEEDEQIILNYYEENIKPLVLKKIKKA